MSQSVIEPDCCLFPGYAAFPAAETYEPGYPGAAVDTPEEVTGFSLADDAPDWVSIDPPTGVITLTPTAGTAIGETTVPVTVTYADGSDDTVAVTDGIAPSITPIDPIIGTVGEPIDDVVIITDDTDAIITVDGLPDGLTFDQDTNTIEGTPTAPVENGTITVTATDAASGSDGTAPEFSGEPDPVDPTDEPQDTGLDLDGCNPDETQVEAKDADNTPVDVTIDDDGSIIIPGRDVEGPITVIVTDPDLDGPIEATVPVTDENDGAGVEEIRLDGAPNTLQPTDELQDSGLNLINPGGDTIVIITDEEGTEIPENNFEIDLDTGAIPIAPGEDVKGPLTLEVTDPSLREAITVDIPINDRDGGEDGDDSPGSSVGSSPGSSLSGLGQCVASPTGKVLTLLSVLGVTAVIGAPGIKPMVDSIGAQINEAAAEISSPVPGLGAPAWFDEVNRSISRAAEQVDMNIAIAALSAEDACAVPGSSIGSSALGSS